MLPYKFGNKIQQGLDNSRPVPSEVILAANETPHGPTYEVKSGPNNIQPFLSSFVWFFVAACLRGSRIIVILESIQVLAAHTFGLSGNHHNQLEQQLRAWVIYTDAQYKQNRKK